MDAIRKKMHSLKVESDQYAALSKKHEEQAEEMNKAADKNDGIIRDLQKKIGGLESNLDVVVESLKTTNISLEAKEKQLDSMEDDVNAVSRKITLLEVESLEANLRMGETVLNVALKSKDADALHKQVRYFESKNMRSEMTIEDQEKDLREASAMVYDSEKKLDEISRRLGITEDELRRALERATIAEDNLVRVENDLRAVGENMKLLEVSEEKALAREEKFKEQIRSMIQRLKEADARAEYGEMNITKLNMRVDEIEDEIVREKLKLQKLGDELGDTFDDILTKY